ncbi:MAG TPA: TonB-dependent receptor [Opitutaceae bacterium]|jgi:hypothetical protein
MSQYSGDPPLVVRDGVPLNDSSTGVADAREVPSIGLGRIEYVNAGESVPWGDWADEGVLQYFSSAPSGARNLEHFRVADLNGQIHEDLEYVVTRTGEFDLEAGSFGRWSAAAIDNEPTAAGVLQVRLENTDDPGTFGVAETERGPVDARTSERSSAIEGKWRQPLGKQAEMTMSVQATDQSQQGVTRYERDHRARQTITAAFAGRNNLDFAWQGTTFARMGRGDGTFSTSNAAQTQETPVMDVSKSPSTELGTSWIGRLTALDRWTISFGTDLDWATSEVRARANFSNGEYDYSANRRGTIASEHVFALGQFTISDRLHATLGAALDGIERSEDFAAFSDHSRIQADPHFGAVWSPLHGLSARLDAQTGFRAPTLGQFVFPEFIDAAVVLPNAQLKDSRSARLDEDVRYTVAPTDDGAKLTVGAHAFESNATSALAYGIYSGPPSALGSALGATPGLSEYEWTNVDSAREWAVSGEVQIDYRDTYGIHVTLTRSEFTYSVTNQSPFSLGRYAPNTPGWAAKVMAYWNISQTARLGADIRSAAGRYEDPDDTLWLPGFSTGDVWLRITFSKHLEWFGQISNLGNQQVLLLRLPNSVQIVSPGREWDSGLRLNW